MTVHIYLHRHTLEGNRCESWRDLRGSLKDFASLEKLAELKIFMMCDKPVYGALSSHSRGPRTLVVDWQRGDSREPTINTVPEADTSDDGNDSNEDEDDDDDDDSNDSDESDDDFQRGGESNDAGRDFQEDTGHCDEEDAESADEDASEDSDQLRSDGADTTSNTETNQSPSLFDFFGVPPEIRDMIYDQPEMLDQEIPLCHDNDIFGSHNLVNRMAATKPCTSLLKVNRQFSSEYEKRCEGRSGLFISEKLENLRLEEWSNGPAMPPKAAKEATFMHIHAGVWCNPFEPYAGLDMRGFGRWLSHCASQLPKLETTTVNLYTCRTDIPPSEIGDIFIEHLDSVISVDQVIELRLILTEDDWYAWRSKYAAKSLLVHWKRGYDVSPRVLDPAVSYEENCCEGSLDSDRAEWEKEQLKDAEEMRLYLAACGE